MAWLLQAIFANRVVGLLNSLTDDIVYSATSVNGFVIKITKHFGCCMLHVLIFNSWPFIYLIWLTTLFEQINDDNLYDLTKLWIRLDLYNLYWYIQFSGWNICSQLQQPILKMLFWKFFHLSQPVDDFTANAVLPL